MNCYEFRSIYEVHKTKNSSNEKEETIMATMKMPSKVGGSGEAWLAKAGVYHVQIIHSTEQPTKKNGELIDGWGIKGKVLTQGDEENKQFELTFYNARVTDTEEQQERSIRKQASLLIAAGLVTEAQMEQEVDFNVADLTNRQVIVDLEMYKPKDKDKEYLQLKFDRVFHIDDPRMKAVPKNADAVKLLPATWRRKPESFDLEKLGGKPVAANGTNGNGSGNAGASGGGVDLDDLLS